MICTEGKLDKLKLDQCKIYLKKHGLRMAGNKDTLIQRIKEHMSILDGGGEEDAQVCAKLQVCFSLEHHLLPKDLYYRFEGIQSSNCSTHCIMSASGPPCGKRTVAGRIIKESYGAAKQHTLLAPNGKSKHENNKRGPTLHHPAPQEQHEFKNQQKQNSFHVNDKTGPILQHSLHVQLQQQRCHENKNLQNNHFHGNYKRGPNNAYQPKENPFHGNRSFPANGQRMNHHHHQTRHPFTNVDMEYSRMTHMIG
ncbi:hypothetical protein Leryth_010199 [Lithospermum erythrorhizon]|nr:hypothetical protein Leryth_010199 [Lithospermum erythrorhizon]